MVHDLADVAVQRVQYDELVYQARWRLDNAEAAVSAAKEAYQQAISDSHCSRTGALYALFALTTARQARDLCKHDLEHLLIERSYETGAPR